MAKIDTSKIEGYATMTPEQKLAALEGYEYADYSAELEKSKQAVTRANAEAAEWKRKHNERLTADEQAEQARQEEALAIKNELAALRKEKAISENISELISQGYSRELARDTAEAMNSGDTARFFANQRKFLEQRDAALRADILKSTPTPPAKGTAEVTKKEFDAMGYTARAELAAKNPTLYNQLSKK